MHGIGVHAVTLVLVGKAEPGDLRTVMLQLVDYAWGRSYARRRVFRVLDRKMAGGAARCSQKPTYESFDPLPTVSEIFQIDYDALDMATFVPYKYVPTRPRNAKARRKPIS